MLAYVFWHWKNNEIPNVEYERRQREFHAALDASRPDGFERSLSFALTGAPWTPSAKETYEDWYIVNDFSALGSLNEGAVSGTLAKPHNDVAAGAEGGTGGVYALRLGVPLERPVLAYWLSKPPTMSYSDFSNLIGPTVERTKSVLWMRQMTLGPAKEFCLHAPVSIELPGSLENVRISLRKIWEGREAIQRETGC